MSPHEEGHALVDMDMVEGNDLSKQIKTYRKEQRTHFEELKKTETKCSTTMTKEISSTQKPNGSTSQPTILVIGDTMVKILMKRN